MEERLNEIITLIKREHPDYKDIPTDHPMWDVIIKVYGFELTVIAAMELKCLISKCMNDDTFRLGNTWEKPREEWLLSSLKRYPFLSHGYCPTCFENAMARVKARKSQA